MPSGAGHDVKKACNVLLDTALEMVAE